MEKNIVLIGFMGTGKTAVGTRLAQKLNRDFIDTDKEIERVTGTTIRDIFLKWGEIRFRSEEALVIKRLVGLRNLVIATGGGAVINEENIDSLKADGIIVCLEAAPEDIFHRINRKRQNRPLLGKHFTVDDVKKMLEDRKQYYNKADIHITTTGMDPDQVVLAIIAKLAEVENERGKS
jgi:shikimate kinase